MALTKKARERLKAEGLNAAAIKKLEGILAENEDADDGDDEKPSGRRVVVYEGDDAESFMTKLFGGKSEDEGDEGDDGDESDEDEADDEPPATVRWFRG